MPLRPACLLAWIALCLTAASCADHECDLGEDHCEGRMRVTCEESSCHIPGCVVRRRFVSESCETACVEQPNAPLFCAVSDEPDPRCGEHSEGSGSDDGYCDGTVAVDCWLGFATSRADCRAMGKKCVLDDVGEATCVVSATPDPRCDAVAKSTAGRDLCDDTELLSCAGRYVESARECRNACVSPRAGVAFCAASFEPDPRCEQNAPRPEPRPTCPDDVHATCSHGYLECLGDGAFIAEPDASTSDAAAADAGTAAASAQSP